MTTATRTTAATVMVATSELGAAVIQLAFERDAAKLWSLAVSILKSARQRPTGEGRDPTIGVTRCPRRAATVKGCSMSARERWCRHVR